MSSLRLFKDHVSSGAYKIIDGERRIVGKFGQVSVVGDVFDIWFVKPDLSPLSTRKLNAIAQNLQEEGRFIGLTGEAYIQTKDESFVLRTLPLLGVRKRRKISPETRAKQTERLANSRRHHAGLC